MPNLYFTLRKNPYKDIFIPLIESLTRPNSPILGRSFHRYVAYKILSDFYTSFQGRVSLPSVPKLSQFRGFAEGNDTLGYIRTSFQGSTPPEGWGDIHPPGLANLQFNLNAINIRRTNDLIALSQCMKAFTDNIDYLEFFTDDYQGGELASIAAQDANLYIRPGVEFDGLTVTTTVEGSLGIKAKSVITTDPVLVSDAGAYFEVYANPTKRVIPWFSVDTLGAAPSLPVIPGVTDVYVKLTLLSTDTPVDTNTKIQTDLIASAGSTELGQIKIVSFPTLGVSIETAEAIVVPPSIFMILPPHGDWAGSFTGGIPGAFEETTIDHNKAIIANLNDRYFIIYDQAGTSYMIWYDYEAGGTEPDIAADIRVPVAIEASDTIESLSLKTDAAVIGTFAFTAVTAFGITIITDKLEGITTNAIPGSASVGDASALTDLIASDLTVLDTGLVADADWEAAYNEQLVPYEATLGINIPFVANIKDGIGTLQATNIRPDTPLRGTLGGGLSHPVSVRNLRNAIGPPRFGNPYPPRSRRKF